MPFLVANFSYVCSFIHSYFLFLFRAIFSSHSLHQIFRLFRVSLPVSSRDPLKGRARKSKCCWRRFVRFLCIQSLCDLFIASLPLHGCVRKVPKVERPNDRSITIVLRILDSPLLRLLLSSFFLLPCGTDSPRASAA